MKDNVNGERTHQYTLDRSKMYSSALLNRYFATRMRPQSHLRRDDEREDSLLYFSQQRSSKQTNC